MLDHYNRSTRPDTRRIVTAHRVNSVAARKSHEQRRCTLVSACTSDGNLWILYCSEPHFVNGKLQDVYLITLNRGFSRDDVSKTNTRFSVTSIQVVDTMKNNIQMVSFNFRPWFLRLDMWQSRSRFLWVTAVLSSIQDFVLNIYFTFVTWSYYSIIF